MPEPTERANKPLRTWRPMAAWTAGILLALGLALVALTIWHRSGGQHEPVLGYEPDVEKISGIVSIGHARHPNGTKMTYPVLTMTKSITVSRNSDGFNQPEQHITEIQLVSDNQLASKLLKSDGLRVEVTGKLFHEHTAWHMCKILMDVESYRPMQDPSVPKKARAEEAKP